MRSAFVLLISLLAASASAKGGGRGAQGVPGGAPAAPPLDPAYQKVVATMRAQAPAEAPVTFRFPSEAESLITAWKASWDRPKFLRERLDALWSRKVAPAERAALFRSLFVETQAEQKIHDSVEHFVRTHLPVGADELLAPPPVGTVATDK